VGELTKGSVIPGKGGKRYVYLGGDPKSKDSYKEFTGEAPKQVGWGEGFEKASYNVGGAVTDAVSRVSGKHSLANPLGVTYPPEVAAGFGLAANVATQAIPSILTGAGVKKGAETILQPVARGLMQSAVKPSAHARMSGNAKPAIETLLKEGINVTQGGVAKLGEKVSALSKQVDDMIAAADKSGVTVNKLDAAKRAQAALNKFQKQVTPGSDMTTIKKAMDEFLSHPDLKALDEIPVGLANEIKKGTYSILGSKPYGEVKGADIEAQKQLARALKEGIEKGVPGVAAPNAKMSEFLNAMEVMAPRAAVAGNNNPFGLSLLTENLGAGAGFMLDRSSLLKSLAARGLYSGAPSILGVGAGLGTAGLMSTTGQEY
jgi:hypothetical protein